MSTTFIHNSSRRESTHNCAYPAWHNLIYARINPAPTVHCFLKNYAFKSEITTYTHIKVERTVCVLNLKSLGFRVNYDQFYAHQHQLTHCKQFLLCRTFCSTESTSPSEPSLSNTSERAKCIRTTNGFIRMKKQRKVKNKYDM